MISITKERLDELESTARFLNCLQAHGLHNWERYGDACDQFNQEPSRIPLDPVIECPIENFNPIDICDGLEGRN